MATLRTYGYSQEELLRIIESAGAIKLACKDAFIIINRQGFYSWMGEEFLTGDLFIEKLTSFLSKNI